LGDTAYNDWVKVTYDVETPQGYLFIGTGGGVITSTTYFKAQDYKYIRASEPYHSHHVEGIYPPLTAFAEENPIFYFIKNTEENRAYMLELINGVKISQVEFEKSLKKEPESPAVETVEVMATFISDAIKQDKFIKVDKIAELIDPNQCQIRYSFNHDRGWILCPSEGESEILDYKSRGFKLTEATLVERECKTSFKINSYHGVYNADTMTWKFGCASISKVTISDAVHFLTKHDGTGTCKGIESIMIGEGKFELKQLQEMKDKQSIGR
jgi:hypothetical protein